MTPPAIQIDSLVKRYGSLRAVDGLSLTIEAGEFFGLLGPNGAGKTTTIQSIVGLSTFQGGTITVFGHDVVKDYRAARRFIGLSPQEFNFDRYLSIQDILIYTAGYFGIPYRQAAPRAKEMLERFGLASKCKETFVRLSGGMKRRLTLARALMYEPRILILDEPTAGVDVELRLDLWQLLKDLNRDGMTIVLTTHYLEEAQELCKRIGIINHGRLAALDTTEGMLARSGREQRTLQDIFLDLTGHPHA
jgi:ABC-2 type transport system ATP-binding protein